MKTSALMTAALAAATLAACGASETTNTTTATTNTAVADAAPAAAPTAATSPAAGAGAVLIAGDGLSIAGRSIPFGTERAEALKAIAAGMGGPADTQGADSDCGPGPLDFAMWSKGLRANFQDGKFVGWGGAIELKTAEGIGFGSTRAAVETAYHPKIEQTSLGTEFTTKGGLDGVFESDAKDAAVSDIWAGMTCVAR